MKKLLPLALSLAVLLQGAAFAQLGTTQADISSSLVNSNVPIVATSPGLSNSKSGMMQMAIKLSDPPLVVAVGANAKITGIKMTAAQQQAYLAQLKAKQDAVMAQVAALGGVELGRVSKGHNALLVAIDGSKTQALKQISGVTAVRPLYDTQFAAVNPNAVPDLATTISYVGGTSVHNAGVTGQGVRIAMLDTGIDYTHYNLGGSGNVADYQAALAAAGTTPPANLFPTSKVVGGYDFTGEVWPNGPLAPDPNPLDLNGHGSHTSDIAGGRSNDGLHVGMAPDAQLYAVKVCSSTSSSCSGVAILEGIDFALDPTNSGTLNNPVDIISMSIGGDFGQREADDAEAFTDVVNFGIVSVVSAGNSGDIPYIQGGPAATPEVLSTAATNSVVGYGVPLVINSPTHATYSNTSTVDWAPITGTTTGDIVYVGRGCPGDTLLANPAGKIALVDRGVCAISLKVDYVANAGAIGVVLGLVAPGDAVAFSNGGGSNFVPTLVITQAEAGAVKTLLGGGAVNGTISINNAISTATDVASYSSRGPNYSYNMIKPDMSAPGTMSAAQPGTGNQETTESGTSFACPITAGSAALLLSANHSLTPADVKARLMETTQTGVTQNSLTSPGALAPITRIGSGLLRVDNAYAGTTAAWDSSNPLAVSLSFGTARLAANTSYSKKVMVRNYSNVNRSYTITNTYVDAPNTTGFTLTYPATVNVPANGSASFAVTGKATAASLPAWTLNGGANGGTGSLLQTVEYAGYLTLTAGSETAHIPWHILPHKAANVVSATSLALGGNTQALPISNLGAPITGPLDVFSLTGTGTQFPASVLPAPGDDFAVINLRAVGVRLVCTASPCTAGAPSSNFAVQFAITTFGQRSHPDVPAEFDIYLDVNNDGNPDFVVYNEDLGAAGGAANSGQNVVIVGDLASGAASVLTYAGADLDSANMIYTVPLSALSSSTSHLSLGYTTPFTYSVYAYDNYYTGNLTDAITGMKYELDMPQYYTNKSNTATFSVPAGFNGALAVTPNNASSVYLTAAYNGNSPSQTGLLLMYTHGKNSREADLVTVTP